MKFVRATGQRGITSTHAPVSVSPPSATGHAAAGGRGRRGVASDLLLLFAVAMAVRLVWALLLPPWQATDETEHFAYVNHIVEQGELPHPSAGLPYPTYSPELQRSLDTTSFYPLVRWDTDTIGIVPLLDPAAYAAARQFAASGMGGTDRDDAGNSRATTYPPLYYLALALPDRLLHSAPVIARLFAMRATSGVFGALSCLFAYLTAYDVFRSRRWGWCLGLCVAFMPTYAQVAASVNNDAPMNLLAMALIWCGVRVALRGMVSASLAVITVVCGGLLFLTKPTALPVLVIAALVIGGVTLMNAWRASRFARFRFAPFAPLVIVPVGLALFAVAWLLYQSVPPVHAFAQAVPFLHAIVSPPQTNFSFGQYLRFLIGPSGRPYAWLNYSQFWGWFGWGYAVLPPAVVAATVPVCLVGFIGAAIRAVRHPRERGVWLLCLAFVLAQIVFLLYGVEYRLSFANFDKVIGLEGRYLFPVLLPILLAVIAGWAHLFHDSMYVLRGAMLAMFALQLVGLSAVLTRYYDVVVGWVG